MTSAAATAAATEQKPGIFAHFGRDFTASIVVFLVAMPLCMGIAIASGVPAEKGLITGIIGGIEAITAAHGEVLAMGYTTRLWAAQLKD